MHFDFGLSLPFASLTTAPFDVETKAAGFVTANPGFFGGGKKLSYKSKRAGVGSRVGSGGSSDWGLVDKNDFIQVFGSLKCQMVSGTILVLGIKLGSQSMVKDVMDKSGFTRAGNAGDTNKLPQRKVHSDVFEIMFG